MGGYLMPPGDFPAIEAALAGPVIDIIRQQWIFLAQPHSATGAYIQALQSADAAQYPYNGDTLSASVVNTSPYAKILEDGHQGFHMPERVRNWPHHNKAGRGYMIVNFRHFAPGSKSSTGRALSGAMPAEIYARAKQLGTQQLRGLGDLYKQSKSYNYMIGANRAAGARVPTGLLRARAVAMQQTGHGGYTWKSSKFEGLRRDAQVTPHANQGVYSTFRVMSQDSPGWYIPGKQGLHLAAETAERVRPLITRLIADAAQRDAVAAIAEVFSGAGFQVEIP